MVGVNVVRYIYYLKLKFLIFLKAMDKEKNNSVI